VGDEGALAEVAVLRPATGNDLDGLVELTWAVAAEGSWIGPEVPFDRVARRQLFAGLVSGPFSTIFVADRAAPAGPGVVGYITVAIDAYGVADIGMLVERDWRGRGIGKALLSAAIDWAGTAGAHKMALEVWPHNAAAIGLYLRAGFVEEGRKRRHYRRSTGELWDSVLMGRPLP